MPPPKPKQLVDEEENSNPYEVIKETGDEVKPEIHLGSLRDKFAKSKIGPAMYKTVIPSNWLLRLGLFSCVVRRLHVHAIGLWPIVFCEANPIRPFIRPRVDIMLQALLSFSFGGDHVPRCVQDARPDESTRGRSSGRSWPCLIYVPSGIMIAPDHHPDPRPARDVARGGGLGPLVRRRLVSDHSLESFGSRRVPRACRGNGHGSAVEVMPPLVAEFDLGEYVGIGLDTNQIAYLAGTLFLGLFRPVRAAAREPRHRRAPGRVGCDCDWLVCRRVSPRRSQLPGRDSRVAQTLDGDGPAHPRRGGRGPVGVRRILMSAHWANGPMARLGYRIAGLGLAALAAWLGGGWFADQMPFQIQEWLVQKTIMRAVVVLALLFLAAAFWVRHSSGPPHARWRSRILTPPAIAMATFLATRWFGTRVWPDLQVSEVESAAVVLGAIGTGTCILIAAGAYLIRERPVPTATPVAQVSPAKLRPAAPSRPLPVAVLLDEQGRPVLPAKSGAKGQAGPTGA